ncbi:MAG: DNA-3-methyladenine glycosylase I [Acidobacteriota bacterium]
MRAPSAARRCPWADSDPLLAEYHDREWGVPSFDDRHLFELLTLEGAQAGLSWLTILRKREGYRSSFAGFDPAAVARFRPARIERLLSDRGIVRHRGKIKSVVTNARAVLAVQRASGSLAEELWRHVGSRPRQNRRRSGRDVPAQSAESVAMSRALRGLGFRFVGPTICYAFMQATGMVNDHLAGCFRRTELTSPTSSGPKPGSGTPRKRGGA